MGIVTIPGSHNNGNCGIMSIHCMYVDNGSVGTGRSSNATNFDMQVANWHQTRVFPYNWTNPDTSLDTKYKYPIHPNIVAANGGNIVTYHKCDSATIRKNVCQIPRLYRTKFLNYYNITEMEAEPSEWKIVDEPGPDAISDKYITYGTSTFPEYRGGG